jgi:hypothetical protein
MIDVADTRPAAAVIGPGDPRARVDGQREWVEGPAAAGDGHVSRGDWVATRLRAWTGRGTRRLRQRLGRTRAEKNHAEDDDYPLGPKGSFQSRLGGFCCAVLLEYGCHNVFVFVLLEGNRTGFKGRLETDGNAVVTWIP